MVPNPERLAWVVHHSCRDLWMHGRPHILHLQTSAAAGSHMVGSCTDGAHGSRGWVFGAVGAGFAAGGGDPPSVTVIMFIVLDVVRSAGATGETRLADSFPRGDFPAPVLWTMGWRQCLTRFSLNEPMPVSCSGNNMDKFAC